MTQLDALPLVIEAVHSITDSWGSPSDEFNLKGYLKDPQRPSASLLGRVGGIPLHNFFAFDRQAFDDEKEALWDELDRRYRQWIQANEPGGTVPLPRLSSYGFDTELRDLAQHLAQSA